MKSNRQLRQEAEQLREEAEGLRDEADSLDNEAERLESQISKENDAWLKDMLPTFRALREKAETVGTSWFERRAIEIAMETPETLEPSQRARIITLARETLGLHIDWPHFSLSS
jgi:predicted nuclease with TOPRIM domain